MMGIYTQYICDRCEHTQDTHNQMWNIGISRTSVDHYGTSINQLNSVGDKQLWCRKCVEELHILPRSKEDEKKNPVPPKPTLEDMIRDIIAVEMNDAR